MKARFKVRLHPKELLVSSYRLFKSVLGDWLRFFGKKSVLNLVVGVLMPIVFIAFVVSERLGFWDSTFGLDKVLVVAEAMETSYGENSNRQVRPQDTAWKPILKLIKKYSTAQLPVNLEPKVIARSRAVASNYIESDGKILAQWTAPSTPLLLLFEDWPGKEVPQEKYRIVGNIQSLRDWVEMSRRDFHSDVVDIFLVIVTIVLSFIIWRKEDYTS